MNEYPDASGRTHSSDSWDENAIVMGGAKA